MRCNFCELLKIKRTVIVENKHARAFPTNIPIVPGHILICPIRCLAKTEDMSVDEREAIHELVLKLKPALVKLFKAQGFNYAWNEGRAAGQKVPHFHLHMLPRKKGDSGITNYEPRKFLYRPGSRKAKPEEELNEVAELIKNELK